MSKLLPVAFDCDDVGFELNRPLAYWLMRQYGTNILYEDIYDFNLIQVFGIEYNELVKRIRLFCLHYWRQQLPMRGAAVALRRLQQYIVPHMVTARCDTLRDCTMGMLDLHFRGMFKELHMTNGFGAKNPDRYRSKLTVCREIGTTVLVDDSLGHVADFAGRPEMTMLLPDHPWNQSKTLPFNVIRCGNWRQPGSQWVHVEAELRRLIGVV